MLHSLLLDLSSVLGCTCGLVRTSLFFFSILLSVNSSRLVELPRTEEVVYRGCMEWAAVDARGQAVSARGHLPSTGRFRPNKAAIPEPVCPSPGPPRRLWYNVVVGRQSGPAAPHRPPALFPCGAQPAQETGAGRGGAAP